MTKYPLLFAYIRVIISAMKHAFAALFLAALLFNISAPLAAARADTSCKYAYVGDGERALFYKHTDDALPLFEVPQTYCLEILGEENGWLCVRYAADEGIYRAIDGYCRPDGLILSDKAPKRAYLNVTLTVTYRPDPAGGVIGGLPEIKYEAAYYGALTRDGKTYSYVYCNGSFGHVTELLEEDYPRNELPSQNTFSPSGSGGANSSATLITALAVTAVAVVAISVLYFTGKKPPADRGKLP